MLHVNLLKPNFAPTSAIHRVAVVQEEDDDTVMDQGRMVLPDGGRLPTELESTVGGCVGQAQETLYKKPGCTSELTKSILLEYSKPFSLCPQYYPAQAERGTEDRLLKGGIIVETTTPWASPIITVVKKGGAIRRLQVLEFKDVSDL